METTAEEEVVPCSDSVIILGSTGSQGGSVLKYLYATSAKNVNIVCVTRNPDDPRSKQLAEVFPRVKVMTGDFEDKHSILRVFESTPNIRSVFLMSTPCLASNGFVINGEAESRVSNDIIDAAKKAKVPHIVFSSVACCENEEAPEHLRSKKIIEDYLKASGIGWTILRPVSFLQIWVRLHPVKKGRLSGLVHGDVKQQWISLDDVGAVAALALDNPAAYSSKTLDLVGDELTGKEMAATIQRRRAQHFRYDIDWMLRLVIQYTAKPLFDERVTLQRNGGHKGNPQHLKDVAATFPPSFNRKEPITFERFLEAGGYIDRELSRAFAMGPQAWAAVVAAVAIVMVLLTAVPEAVYQDVQKRWAFYGLCFSVLVYVLKGIWSIFAGK